VFSGIKKMNYLLDTRSKKQFSLLFILLFIRSLLDAFGIGIIAPYIAVITDPSMVFKNSTFKQMNIYLNIESNIDLIIFMSFSLIFFYLVKNLLSVSINYCQSRLVYSKRSLQHSRLLSLYVNAPYTFHLEHNSAELDRNMKFNSGGVFGFLQDTLVLFYNLILSIFIFGVLLMANWKVVVTLGTIILILSSIFLSVTKKYSKKLGVEVQNSMLKSGHALSEGLRSIVEIKLHGIENFFPAKLFKAQMKNARANWRQATLNLAPQAFFEVLTVSSISILIILLTFRGSSLNDVLPMLALFSVALIRLIPSITMIMRSIQQINFNIPAVNIIYSDFKKLNKMNQSAEKTNQADKNPLCFDKLIISDLEYSFDDNSKVLSKINLEINKGEAIGITGPSGCGKTTLINIILGLLNPKVGNVLINDEAIFRCLSIWRSIIGYVPQSIALIDASIKNNIAFGLENKNIDINKVWKALEEANLTDFVKSLSDGLDTFIGENGIRLSGGQRQRLGLARALYREPQVLVFDEATSSLDIDSEQKITNEIMNLSGQRTLIIVAHRISTIKNCDTIYYMNNGKIIDYGSFKKLQEENSDFHSLASQINE